MQISFDTAHTSPDELTALIALCASLGGRLPEQTSDMTVAQHFGRIVRAELSEASTSVAGIDDEGAAPASAEGNDQNGTTVTPPVSTNQPSASGVTADPATSSAELDADGIPWDERIHASTKTKTKADVWTKKRNVDEVLYGQIHAELQELHAGNDDTPPPPRTDELPTSDENVPTDDTDVPPPPAPDASAGFSEFPELVQAVAQYGLPYVKLGQLAGEVTDGLVAKFPDLRDKPDYWSAFFDAVKREVAA